MAQAQRRRVWSFWPKQLETFKRCPHAYQLQYERKLRARIVVQPALSRGRVTHEVLAHAFKVFAGRKSFPADLRREVTERLPRADYDGVDAWQSDVEVVAGWVDGVVETFDQRKQVVAVERVYAYPHPGRAGEPSFALQTRVDLVLRLDDGALEHVDWKTGRRAWTDEIQNITARIALGRHYQESRVRSTTTFLAIDAEESDLLTREEVGVVWSEIKGLVHDIVTDDARPPRQNPLCHSCPYFEHGCVLHRRPGT